MVISQSLAAAFGVARLARPLQHGQRHQQQRRGEDRRDHARGVELDRQVRALLLHPARGLALGILDQHPALGPFHETDDEDQHHRERDDADDDDRADRPGAAALEQLGDALRKPGDDAGHDDQRHAVADAAAGDLLADPHQEQGAADEADGARDLEQQARLDDRLDALVGAWLRGRGPRGYPAPA